MKQEMFSDLLGQLAHGALVDELALQECTEYARDTLYELLQYVMALEDGYRVHLLALERKETEIRTLKSALRNMECRQRSLLDRLAWLSTVPPMEAKDGDEEENEDDTSSGTSCHLPLEGKALDGAAEDGGQAMLVPTEDNGTDAEDGAAAAREKKYREILDSVDAGCADPQAETKKQHVASVEWRTAKNCAGCIYRKCFNGGSQPYCGYCEETGKCRTVDENGNKRDPLDEDGNCRFRETKRGRISRSARNDGDGGCRLDGFEPYKAPAEKPKWVNKPKWDVEAGKMLYEAGVPVKQIGERLGVLCNTVSMYAKKHGWTRKETAE